MSPGGAVCVLGAGSSPVFLGIGSDESDPSWRRYQSISENAYEGRHDASSLFSPFFGMELGIFENLFL